MHNLFAFNVSKEVNDVPTVSFTYDPEQQVSVWLGDNTVKATLHCTQVPYSQTRCYPDSEEGCKMWLTTVGPRYYDSMCES